MPQPITLQIADHQVIVYALDGGGVTIQVSAGIFGWQTFTIPPEQWLEIVAYTEPYIPKPQQ